MTTELGKYLKHMRVDYSERLFDMANRLGVSSAFLSAVERGKKTPPTDFEKKVSAEYNLIGDSLMTLQVAIDKTKKSFNLIPDDLQAHDTAALLARKFNNLSEEQLNNIHNILTEEDKD